jgi:hypothetical protein
MLYERTIDFGAHPNERGVSGSTTFDESPGRTTFQAIYLHSDSLSLEHVIKTTAQIGLGALLIFERIFPQRFRILGIDANLEALRRAL